MASKDTIIKMLLNKRNCITTLENNESNNTLINGKRNIESNDKSNANKVIKRKNSKQVDVKKVSDYKDGDNNILNFSTVFEFVFIFKLHNRHFVFLRRKLFMLTRHITKPSEFKSISTRAKYDVIPTTQSDWLTLRDNNS